MTVSNPSSSTCDTECCDFIYDILDGYVNLTSGQQVIIVTFSARPAEYGFRYGYVENLVDASPLLGIGWTCTARSLTSFTVKLDATTDSVNYVFRYSISTVRTQV